MHCAQQPRSGSISASEDASREHKRSFQVNSSRYLRGTPRPASRDFGRVLVVGDDRFAIDLSVRLAQDGQEVVLLGHGERETGRHGDCDRSLAKLRELRGFAGNFEAVLSTPSEEFREQIGSVVVVSTGTKEPRYQAYGLVPSDRVISISGLETLFAEGRGLPEPRGEWFHAAFLCGLAEEADTAVFARVLDLAETLNKRDHVQTYVFTRNVKVAAAGFERRYRATREQGTLYFKFDDSGPLFESRPEGPALVFRDPLLGREMELVPDLVVVDEAQGVQALQPVLDAIPSRPAFEPFLQPESLRFTGVETPKAGILALGPSRGVFLPELIEGDIESAVAAVRRMNADAQRSARSVAPEVDPEKCTMCLTCVRLCPHGAMGFEKAAYADPVSCFRCGICAAECPMEAITSPAPSREEVTASVRASASDSGKIAAFLCHRSAANALEAAGPRVRDSVVPLVVPCAGAVSLSLILRALADGAAGVLVAGCFKGNCASIYGTALAEARLGEARRMLVESGMDAGRVRFASTASNATATITQAVQELHAAIQPRTGGQS
jgi:quinone-modifying oxidoreductase, subunit QmoB